MFLFSQEKTGWQGTRSFIQSGTKIATFTVMKLSLALLFLSLAMPSLGVAALKCTRLLEKPILVLSHGDLMDSGRPMSFIDPVDHWRSILDSNRKVRVEKGPLQTFWTVDHSPFPTEVNKKIVSALYFSFHIQGSSGLPFVVSEVLARQEGHLRTSSHHTNWNLDEFRSMGLLIIVTDRNVRYIISDQDRETRFATLKLELEKLKESGFRGQVESVFEMETVNSKITRNRAFREERVPLPALLRKEDLDVYKSRKKTLSFLGGKYYYGKIAFHDYYSHSTFVDDIVFSLLSF